MPKIYWDEIDQGDPVIPLTKPPVTRVQIAKFAGATQDYAPLHIDDDFAKAAGYGGVFAHGLTSLGFATEGITRWLENGRIIASTAKFQKLVWPGDIITAKGVVVERYERNDEARIDVDIWAENQNHDIVMSGMVTCVLWRNEKEERKNKGRWPSLSSATIAERRTAAPIAAPKPARRTAGSDVVRPSSKTLQRGTPVQETATKKKAANKKAAAKKAAKKPAAKKAATKKTAKKATAKKAAPKKTAKKATAKKAATKKTAKKAAKKKKK